MYKHHVKVYDEDLAVADISQTSVDGQAVNAGGTLNALGVNVYAVGAVKVAGTVTVTISADDAKDGGFSETVTSVNLTAGDYVDDGLIAQIALPVDVKTWVKGKVAGNSSASGTIRVALDYLGR